MGNHSKCFKCGGLDEFCVCRPEAPAAATDQPSDGQVLPPFEQDVHMVDECMRDCEPDDQRAWKRIRNVAMGDAISQMAQEALARASLTPTAPQAASQQATVKDALRRCGADTDYHGKMLFS